MSVGQARVFPRPLLRIPSYSHLKSVFGAPGICGVKTRETKTGEVDPEDLSANLIVQLGCVTEDLNRRWYELNTSQVINDIGTSSIRCSAG